MTYELAFDRRALKEWQKLGHTIREQFKRNWQNGWKIHAYPQPGYMVMLIAIKSNFVHLATDLYIKSLMKVVLLVIAVGRRESSEVYQIADMR